MSDVTVLEVCRVLYYFGPAYAADVSPVIANRLLPSLAAAVDRGVTFRGRPILGSHKTWRGLIAGIVASIFVWEAQRALDRFDVLHPFALVDYEAAPIVPGLLMGLGAGVGDIVKSLFKRRLGIAPGAPWLVCDQLDFFFGALAFVSLVYVPPLPAVLAALPIVFVCGIAATTMLWHVGLKESWW